MEKNIIKGGCGHSEQELVDSANIVVCSIIACAIFTVVALIAA